MQDPTGYTGNLKVDAQRAKFYEVHEQCEDIWSLMWHNGSLAYVDYPEDMDWDWLGENVQFWCKDLEESIFEKFKLDVNVHQQGATFYIAELANDGWHRRPYSKSGFCIEKFICIEDFHNLEDEGEPEWNVALKNMVNIHEMLKYFDATVREIAKDIPEWWAEEKQNMEVA